MVAGAAGVVQVNCHGFLACFQAEEGCREASRLCEVRVEVGPRKTRFADDAEVGFVEAN